MDNFVIKTENLTKDYSSWLRKAKKPALKDLTISIPKGSVFGFLGPNGAGKTTTIKILMGLIRPTGGTATVLGKPYDDVEVKNRIGFLPDSRHSRRSFRQWSFWMSAQDFSRFRLRSGNSVFRKFWKSSECRLTQNPKWEHSRAECFSVSVSRRRF